VRTVQLGSATVPVVPQKRATLRHRLASVGDGLAETLGQGADNVEGFILALEDREYDVLSILIPALPEHIPLWAWHGYVSQEAMDSRSFDPEDDRSVPFPDTVEAFKVATEVNRLDLFLNLKALIDPKLLRELVSGLLEDMAAKTAQTNSLTGSLSANGTSESTSGSPSSPTSAPSGDGPSPVSSVPSPAVAAT